MNIIILYLSHHQRLETDFFLYLLPIFGWCSTYIELHAWTIPKYLVNMLEKNSDFSSIQSETFKSIPVFLNLCILLKIEQYFKNHYTSYIVILSKTFWTDRFCYNVDKDRIELSNFCLQFNFHYSFVLV